MYLTNFTIIRTQIELINELASASFLLKTTMKAHTVKNMKKSKKTIDEVRSIW